MELEAKFTAMDGSGQIVISYLEPDSRTEEKIKDILRTCRVTSDNQELHFKSLIIESGLDLFVAGQSSMVKRGNQIIMTEASIHPKKFRGSMKGLLTGTDGRDYLQEIIIPGIQFFVGEQVGIPDGEETIFSDVYATVYPR